MIMWWSAEIVVDILTDCDAIEVVLSTKLMELSTMLVQVTSSLLSLMLTKKS